MKKAMSASALIGGVAFGCGGRVDDPGPPYEPRPGLQFYVESGVLAIDRVGLR